MSDSSLLIQNANVIDGTGAPARTASVLVTGEKIEAVGAAADSAAARLPGLNRLTPPACH